jgi:hypothetical protein
VVFGFIALMNVARNPRFEAFHTRRRVGVDGLRRGFSPVRQFDPYTRPRLARWPIPGRLSQCLLLPVHVWLTAKLGADVPAETSSGRCCMGAAPRAELVLVREDAGGPGP